MTGTYQLTHDEQKAAKARLLTKARLQRLLQVRAQNKQLAKARSRTFKQLCTDSSQQLREELVLLINQHKEQELAQLRAQYQAAVEGLASAQRDAAVSAQQLAIEREQKHQNFLQREKEAQQRFAAALSRVQAARQAELQVVLGQMQLRQEIMLQQRELARSFAEQQKKQQVQAAQRQEELNILEEQRRRQNQVSRIDFKYSRLHELGVPQLVVNHRDVPGEGAPDAATQAQTEAVRTRDEQLALQQRQQEHAKKAAERGVNAQMLIKAERNRQRMEQALRELESNEIEQQKQDLATGKLNAAPLLRKWQQQKRKAQAKRAFEQEFLPDPARAQHGLPSFLAYADQPAAAVAEAEDTTPAGQAAAAERALRLVAELERQRQTEARAAQRQRQVQLEQQAAAAAEAATAAAAKPSSSAASSELDIPVPVEDLMDFIPPASAQAAALAPGAGHEAVESSDVTSALYLETTAVSSAGGTASTGQVQPAAAVTTSDVSLSEGQKLAADASAARASTVGSSQDSIAAIMQAADEVLRQLPAEMQAAAARRAAAAAGQKLPQPTCAAASVDASATAAVAATAGQRESTASAATQPAAAAHTARAAATETAAVQSEGIDEPVISSGDRNSRTTDSSADAAAILQELHQLQEQLGMELLGSSTAGSDLEQLAAFDDEVQRILQQQMTQPARAPQPTPAAAAAATRQASQPAAPAARPVVGHQRLAASGPEVVAEESSGSQTGAGPGRTELEDLIDRILTPDYPNNHFGPLAGPQPSVSSPTRPAGKSGRRAAAESAAQQQQQQTSFDLASGFREVQQELKALGLPSLDLSSISSSTSGGEDAFLQGVLQHQLSSSGSELTLPTTVLGAMGRFGITTQGPSLAAAAGGVSAGMSTGLVSTSSATAPAAGALPAQRTSLQQQQRTLQPGLQTSKSAPSMSAAAAAAAARGSVPAESGAAAAAMAAAKQAILDLSSSLDSLSTSTDTSEIDKLLGSIPGQLQTGAPTQRRPVAGSALSNSAVSLPTTILEQPAVAAAAQLPAPVSMAASIERRVPAAAAGAYTSAVISMPSTLQLQHQAAAGRAAAAGAAANEDSLAAVRELLSLRGSDSSSESPAARGQAGTAAAAGPASSSSSSISSMLDDELDQLLQKALGSASGRGQQQQVGSIEQALEAMAGLKNPATAAETAASASMLSMSTTIPSTVRANMPQSTAAAAGGGVRGSHVSRPTTVRATEAAAAPGSPDTSDSSSNGGSSASSSSAGSGFTTSSSRSEAALRMAKQSARQRAAAGAAAVAAAGLASAAGSSSGMTSLPSTIERQLEAVAAGKSDSAAGAVGSSTGSDLTPPGAAAPPAGGGAVLHARPTDAGAAGVGSYAGSSSSMSPSLPSTVEKMFVQQQQQLDSVVVHQQQQQQQAVRSWAASSSSSTVSLPAPVQQRERNVQQVQPVWLTPGTGSVEGSSSTSLPSTILRFGVSSSGSSAVAVGSSTGDSSSVGFTATTAIQSLPPRAPATTAVRAAAAASSGQQQQLQPRQQLDPMQATAATALGGPFAVLEPIEEEEGTVSASITAGSPAVSTSVGSALCGSRQDWQQQQQGSTSTPAGLAARPSSSGSSSSTSGSGAFSRGDSGSSNDGDGSGSRDSFSGVVSELMQHIDSTLASLGGASTSSIPPHQHVAAAALGHAGASTSSGATQRQSTPASLSSLSRSAAPMAVNMQLHQQRRHQHPVQQPHGGGGSSTGSSGAAGSDGVPLTPSGSNSGNSSGATDSSTARFIQRALADMDMEPISPESSASTAGNDAGTSRLLYSSAQQGLPLVATSAAAAAGQQEPAHASAGAVQRQAFVSGRPQTMHAGSAAAGAVSAADITVVTGSATPPPAAAAGGGRQGAADAELSLGETVSSSGVTVQLLGSLGSLLAGSTLASSSRSGVSSGSSNFSFHAAAEQQQSPAVDTGFMQDSSGGVSHRAARHGHDSEASSGSIRPQSQQQQRQQQQVAPSSGLSQLLADILSEDPELASQVGPQP